MITVIPDTNALFGTRWMTTGGGVTLAAHVAKGDCLVVLPEVVVDELERRHRDRFLDERKSARAALRSIKKSIDMASIEHEFDSRLDEVGRERGALLARSGIELARTPDSGVRALVKRDLARRHPFLETEQDDKPKSFGFRDAVIWETILVFLQTDDEKRVIHFVTKDRGFIGKAAGKPALHPHLLEDLDRLGIERSRVVLVDTLENAVAVVEAALAEAEAEAAETAANSAAPTELALLTAASARSRATDAARRVGLVRVATDALESLVGKDITEQISYGGEYQNSDFADLDYPSALETGHIVAVDLETEISFEPPNGDIVTASADLVLSIDGVVSKGDYFGDEEDDLWLVGELNDYYFEVSTEIRVHAVMQINTAQGTGHHEDVEIALTNNRNPPPPTDPTSVTLDFVLDSSASESTSEVREVELDPDPGSTELDPDPGDSGDTV